MAQMTTTTMAEESSLPLPPRQTATRTRMRTRTTLREQNYAHKRSIRKTNRPKRQGIRVFSIPTVGLIIAVLAVIATSASGLSVRVPGQDNALQTNTNTELLMTDIAIERHIENEAAPWEPLAKVQLSSENGGSFLLRCRDHIIPTTNLSTFAALAIWNRNISFAGKVDNINAALHCLFYRSANDFSGNETVHIAVELADAQHTAHVPIRVAPADELSRPRLNLAIARLSGGITEDPRDAFPLGERLGSRIIDPLQASLGIEISSIANAVLEMPGYARTGLTAAQAQAALDALTYLPSVNFFGQDVVSIRVVNEDTNASDAKHLIVDVRAVNDAPTLSLGDAIRNMTLRAGVATPLRTLPENQAGVVIADIDATPGERFRCGIRAPPGVLQIARHAGVHVSTTANVMGTSDVETILQGTLPALHAALRNIVLAPSSDAELTMWFWAMDASESRSEIHKLTLQVQSAPLQALFERPAQAPITFDISQGTSFQLSALEVILSDNSDSVHAERNITTVISLALTIDPAAGFIDVISGEQIPYWVARQGLGTAQIHLQGSPAELSTALTRLELKMDDAWESSTQRGAVTLTLHASAASEDLASSSSLLSSSSPSVLIVQLFVIPRQTLPVLEFVEPSGQDRTVRLGGPPVYLPFRASFSTYASSSTAEAHIRTLSQNNICGSSQLAIEPKGLHVESSGNDLILRGEAERVSKALLHLVFAPSTSKECSNGILPQQIAVVVHLVQQPFKSSRVTIPVLVKSAEFALGFVLGSTSPLKVRTADESGEQSAVRFTPDVLRLENLVQQAETPSIGSQAYTLWVQARIGSFTLAEQVHKDVTAIFSDQGRSLVLKSVDLSKLRTTLSQVVYTPFPATQGLEVILVELHVVQSGRTTSSRACEAIINIEVERGDTTFEIGWTPSNPQELSLLTRESPKAPRVYEAGLQGIEFRTSKSHANPLLVEISPASESIVATNFHIDQDAQLGLSLLSPSIVHGPLDEILLAVRRGLLRARMTVAAESTAAQSQLLEVLLTVGDLAGSQRSLRNASIENVKGLIENNRLAEPYSLTFTSQDAPQSGALLREVELLVGGSAYPFPNLLANPVLANDEHVAQGLELPSFEIQSWSASEVLSLQIQTVHGLLRVGEDQKAQKVESFETVASLNAWLAQGLRYFPTRGIAGLDHVSCAIHGKDRRLLYSTQVVIFVGDGPRGLSPEESPLADSATLEVAKDTLVVDAALNDAQPIILDLQTHIVQGTPRALYKLEVRPTAGMVIFTETQGLAMSAGGAILQGQRDKLNAALASATFAPVHGLDEMVCNLEILLRRPANPAFVVSRTIHLSVQRQTQVARDSQLHANNAGGATALGVLRRNPDQDSTMLRVEEGQHFEISGLGWTYTFERDIAQLPIIVHVSTSQGHLLLRNPLDALQHQIISQADDAIIVRQVAQDIPHLLDQLEVQLPEHWNSMSAGDVCFVEIALLQGIDALDEVTPLIIPVHVQPPLQRPSITGTLALEAGAAGLSLSPLFFEGWTGFAYAKSVDLELGSVAGGQILVPDGLGLANLQSANAVHEAFVQITATLEPASGELRFRVKIYEHATDNILCERSFYIARQERVKSARISSEVQVIHANQDQSLTLENLALNFVNFDQEACELLATAHHGTLTIVPSQTATSQLRCSHNGTAQVHCLGTPESLASIVASGLHYRSKASFNGIDTLALHFKLKGADPEDYLTEVSLPVIVHATASQIELSIEPISASTILSALEIGASNRLDFSPAISVPILLQGLDARSHEAHIRLRSDGGLRGSWQITHPAFQTLQVNADEDARVLELKGALRKLQKALEHHTQFKLMTPLDARTTAQSTELIVEAWIDSDDEALQGATAPHAADRRVLQLPLTNDNGQLQLPQSGCFVQFESGCQTLRFLRRASLSRTGLRLGWHENWFSPPTRTSAVISVRASGAVRLTVPEHAAIDANVTWSLSSTGQKLDIIAASLENAERWLHNVFVEDDPSERHRPRASLSIQARLQTEHPGSSSSATCMLPSLRASNEVEVSISVETDILIMSAAQTQVVVPRITVERSPSSAVAQGRMPVEARVSSTESQALRISVHPSVTVRLGIFANQSDPQVLHIRASSESVLNDALANLVLSRSGDSPWDGDATLAMQIDDEFFENVVHVHVEAPSPNFWEVPGSYRRGILHGPTVAKNARMSMIWQHGEPLSFDGLRIGSAMSSNIAGLRSIRVEATNGHGLWLDDALSQSTTSVITNSADLQRTTLIILEPQGVADTGLRESQLLETVCNAKPEIHSISIADSATSDPISGSFRVSWRGRTSNDIVHNASSSEIQAELEAIVDIGALTVTREVNSDSSASEAYTWLITFSELSSGPTGDVFEIEDAMFSSASAVVFSQLERAGNVIGGAFRLGYFGRWTPLLSWNVGPSELEHSLIGLAPTLLKSGVHVTLESEGSWGTRSYRITFDMLGQFPLIEPDTTMLTGDGASMTVTRDTTGVNASWAIFRFHHEGLSSRLVSSRSALTHVSRALQDVGLVLDPQVSENLWVGRHPNGITGDGFLWVISATIASGLRVEAVETTGTLWASSTTRAMTLQARSDTSMDNLLSALRLYPNVARVPGRSQLSFTVLKAVNTLLQSESESLRVDFLSSSALGDQAASSAVQCTLDLAASTVAVDGFTRTYGQLFQAAVPRIECLSPVQQLELRMVAHQGLLSLSAKAPVVAVKGARGLVQEQRWSFDETAAIGVSEILVRGSQDAIQEAMNSAAYVFGSWKELHLDQAQAQITSLRISRQLRHPAPSVFVVETRCNVGVISGSFVLAIEIAQLDSEGRVTSHTTDVTASIDVQASFEDMENRLLAVSSWPEGEAIQVKRSSKTNAQLTWTWEVTVVHSIASQGHVLNIAVDSSSLSSSSVQASTSVAAKTITSAFSADLNSVTISCLNGDAVFSADASAEEVQAAFAPPIIVSRGSDGSLLLGTSLIGGALPPMNCESNDPHVWVWESIAQAYEPTFTDVIMLEIRNPLTNETKASNTISVRGEASAEQVLRRTMHLARPSKVLHCIAGDEAVQVSGFFLAIATLEQSSSLSLPLQCAVRAERGTAYFRLLEGKTQDVVFDRDLERLQDLIHSGIRYTPPTTGSASGSASDSIQLSCHIKWAGMMKSSIIESDAAILSSSAEIIIHDERRTTVRISGPKSILLQRGELWDFAGRLQLETDEEDSNVSVDVRLTTQIGAFVGLSSDSDSRIAQDVHTEMYADESSVRLVGLSSDVAAVMSSMSYFASAESDESVNVIEVMVDGRVQAQIAITVASQYLPLLVAECSQANGCLVEIEEDSTVLIAQLAGVHISPMALSHCSSESVSFQVTSDSGRLFAGHVSPDLAFRGGLGPLEWLTRAESNALEDALSRLLYSSRHKWYGHDIVSIDYTCGEFRTRIELHVHVLPVDDHLAIEAATPGPLYAVLDAPLLVNHYRIVDPDELAGSSQDCVPLILTLMTQMGHLHVEELFGAALEAGNVFRPIHDGNRVLAFRACASKLNLLLQSVQYTRMRTRKANMAIADTLSLHVRRAHEAEEAHVSSHTQIELERRPGDDLPALVRKTVADQDGDRVGAPVPLHLNKQVRLSDLISLEGGDFSNDSSGSSALLTITTQYGSIRSETLLDELETAHVVFRADQRLVIHVESDSINLQNVLSLVWYASLPPADALRWHAQLLSTDRKNDVISVDLVATSYAHDSGETSEFLPHVDVPLVISIPEELILPEIELFQNITSHALRLRDARPIWLSDQADEDTQSVVIADAELVVLELSIAPVGQLELVRDACLFVHCQVEDTGQKVHISGRLRHVLNAVGHDRDALRARAPAQRSGNEVVTVEATLSREGFPTQRRSSLQILLSEGSAPCILKDIVLEAHAPLTRARVAGPVLLDFFLRDRVAGRTSTAAISLTVQIVAGSGVLKPPSRDDPSIDVQRLAANWFIVRGLVEDVDRVLQEMQVLPNRPNEFGADRAFAFAEVYVSVVAKTCGTTKLEARKVFVFPEKKNKVDGVFEAYLFNSQGQEHLEARASMMITDKVDVRVTSGATDTEDLELVISCGSGRFSVEGLCSAAVNIQGLKSNRILLSLPAGHPIQLAHCVSKIKYTAGTHSDTISAFVNGKDESLFAISVEIVTAEPVWSLSGLGVESNAAALTAASLSSGPIDLSAAFGHFALTRDRGEPTSALMSVTFATARNNARVLWKNQSEIQGVVATETADGGVLIQGSQPHVIQALATHAPLFYEPPQSSWCGRDRIRVHVDGVSVRALNLEILCEGPESKPMWSDQVSLAIQGFEDRKLDFGVASGLQVVDMASQLHGCNNEAWLVRAQLSTIDGLSTQFTMSKSVPAVRVELGESVDLVGCASDVNAALRALVLAPETDTFGDALLQCSVSRLASTDEDRVDLRIEFEAVHDGPRIRHILPDHTLQVLEGETLVLGGFYIQDAEATSSSQDAYEVMLRVPTGTIYAGSPAEERNIRIARSDNGDVILQGLLSELNLELKSVLYTAPSRFTGTLNLEASVQDKHEHRSVSTVSVTVAGVGTGISLRRLQADVLTSAPSSSVSLAGVVALEDDLRAPEFAQLTVTADPAGAQPEVQQIVVRRPVFSDVHLVRLAATQNEAVAPATFILSYDGETTGDIDRAALDSASKELGSSLGASMESMLAALGTVDQVEVSRTKLGAYGLEWAITFFRTSPGPALVLESETDPSNAIDVTISRSRGVDELELEGNFTLQLGSRISTSLSFDTPAVFIQRALEALPTVHLVHVDEQALLASEDAEVFNAWTVTFVRPAGDIPLLKALVLNSTVPEVRVEISEITKGQGVAAVQRVITSARHQNMVLALRSTAVMGPVEGTFRLALDLRSLGGSRVVSNVVDHAAVATIAEERVHSARGSRPGDSIESVVNAMLRTASRGLEAHFESFDSTTMYVSVSRSDQICEHDCKVYSEEYPVGPLCTFDSACDVCVGLCSEAQDKRCFQDSHCLGSCLLPATGKTGECLSSGNPCATNNDCLSSGVCDASNCVANADGAFTWFIEFHNAPSALPLLEIEENHLVAVDTPDLYIGLLQARKASPVPEVAANQVSGSLALDGITFTHAADTDITLPQILSFASGPDLEAGLVLYLIDLGRAASGLPFPIDVNGSLLEGQGVHVDSALKFPLSRVKSEPELQLDVETTGVSWVEYMARNAIRFQGTVPELNDVLQQSVKGLRVSGHRGWYGRALIDFEATALTSDDGVGLHESVLVDVAPRTPEVRLQLTSSVRSLREDLDIFVFGSKPGQIEAIVFGDEDIPLRLSVQVSVGFVWILPEYRLLHRSIAEANERPPWSQPESSLVFKGTLTEVRSALAHLQYRSATLGVAELKLDISADLTQGLGHNSSLAEIPAISRTVFLNVRALDQPLLFVNGTLHRDISVLESESVSLLSEVRLVSEEPLRETVEATLEVQRGKLALAVRDEWDGQDEVAVSENGKMLRVRSTREGLNQQVFPYVLYRAARTHYTGEDMGILMVTSAATQRLVSLTIRISITETDDPLQIVAQSPTEPLRILEDQPLPLEGIFHITDVDQVPKTELRDENITLELRTFARHVDMQQAIRTTADGGVLNGHFKVSIDLTPWGGTVAESERIAANAVPSITSERTTHATGTGRGESVEAKINALLAQAQNGSILTEPITVSVSQTDEVCSYECKTVLAAYDSSSLLCSKSAHCDLCVGHCQGGTIHRCSSDADCDGGSGSCLFSRGECLSDGSPCSSHVSCQEAGECIASGCAANTVGGNSWTITFSKAPWDLPMLFITEEKLFGATNARVACDVIIDRTPARPVQESNRLGGSFRINDKVLSYNASAKEVQTVFEELAELALVRNATLHGLHAAPVPVGGSFVEIVEREGPSLEDGYVWTIRMTAAAQAFASSLIVDSALLEGLEPEASLHFVGENVTPITGAHVLIESKHGVVGVRGTGRQNAVGNYSVQLADSSLLEEYLDSLIFLPDQNWNSEAGRDFASVRVEVLKDDDLKGRARAATQLVHVAAVNDGPVLHVPGQVLDENDLTADQVSGRLLSVNEYSVREGSTERIAGLSIRDVDAGTKAIHIDLLATNGTLSLAAEVALQDFQQTNASSMSWTGSVSAVNYAFQQLLFTSKNMFGNGGNASVHIIATDGGHSGNDGSVGSDSVTVPLLVVANDDSPELIVPMDRHAWHCREDDSLALPGLLIRYDNYPEHESVQLEAYASHGVVQVPVVLANVSMSSLPDQGLFLEGTVAAVNGALAEAIYTPNADYSSTQTQQPDEITFTLRSVRGDIVHNSASVYVEAVNDEPFLSVPGATVEYDGAGRYVTTATPTLTIAEDRPLIMPAMTVIDADGDFEVIHLTISCQYGSLRLAHTAAELSIEVSAESSTLWVSGQLGRVNKALGEAQDAGVVYTPTRDWSGTDVVIISVRDAAGSTDMVTLTIVVEAVNDAPVWQLPDPASLRVDEDGALELSTVRVLDVDVDAADPFLVRIEPVHGMVSVLNEAKSRSIVLNSTLSLVNQALSSLLFYPASHAHALDDEAKAEAIHFIADDLGSVGSGGPRTKESVLPIVNVIPWTDPPRIEVPGAVYANATTCQKSTRRSWPRRVEDASLFDICGAIIDVAPIEALEDGDVRISGIRVQDSDLDVALILRRLRVELTVSNGRLHVSPRGAANFVTGSDGRLVEFFGSPNECNLILDSIVYRPDLHWYGLDYLRIVAEDSIEMNSGVMGVASLRDEQMIPLHILPVQDVPQFTGELTQAYSGPAMLTTSEDQPLFLAGPHRELSLVHADGDKVEVAFIGIARHGTMSLDPDDFVEVKYLENLTQGVGAAAKGQVEVLAFTASVSTVREAIRHIIYVPEENWSGVEDITMISANLEDLSTDQLRLGDDFLGILSSRVAEATGSRGIDVVDDRYSSVVIHITVRATNDAPSVGLRSDAHSGHWVCEEDAQVNLEGINVDDVDGDAVQVTLRAEHGKPDISDLDVTSRKLFVAVDRDDSSLILYGPVGDVNVLFEEDLISYSPSLNWFGLDTIEVVIKDQDGASASMTGSVLVSAVNDAPKIRSMTRTGAKSVFTVAEGGRLHLSGPSRLLDADAESEIVEERLEQPAAGIWRSLVVRPGRVTDDEPSWRYSLASNASEPESLTALDADTFVFSAEDGTHGRELWRSDGRADADFASTMLIKDIRPGAQSANIDNLHLHDDGLVYFAADGKDWTWMLETDTCGGFLEAVPGIWLAVSKETTFDRFGSYDCPSGYHWASTAELAAVVGPATARAEARSGQMHSYYASLCGWSFDQWEGATRHRFMLADSYETSVFLDARQEAGSPGQLAPEVLAGGVLDETVFAGTICMADAADGAQCSRSLGCFKDAGRELWATDGTAEGTKRVVDVLPGGDGSHPSDLVSFKGDLFFAAWTELHGRELWRSDGTPQGTRMVQDLWAGTGSSDPQLLTAVGSMLFFTAEDEWHGIELWVSDGAPAYTGARPSVVRTGSAGTGTYMVLDLRTGDQVGSEPTDLVHLVDNFVAFAAGDGVHGRQIWVSDGSELGTGYITDIRSDRSELGCDPQDLVVYNQQLYFTAVDGAHGRELWRVGGIDESFTATRPDGTTFAVGSGSSPLGATMVADLLPGSQGAMPTHLHVFSPSEALDPALRGVDLLVFNAMNALWVLNSASSSAVPHRAFETTAADLRFTDTGFVNLRGALFFGARPPYDTLNQRTGARQVSRKQPFFLVDVDAGSDELFFLKIETELGRIVFQDGTEAAAGVSGTLEELNVLLQSVYFEAIDGTNGAGFIIATLVDSSGASTVKSFDVLVTPVNSVPVLTLSRTSVRVSRSGPKVVPLHIDVSVSDEVEVPTAILEVAIASDIGKLRIEPLDNVAIVSKGERDFVLEAEKDALSSVLSTLRLELDASFEASRYGTITLILRDHGDRGEGGPLETTAQIEIEIVD